MSTASRWFALASFTILAAVIATGCAADDGSADEEGSTEAADGAEGEIVAFDDDEGGGENVGSSTSAVTSSTFTKWYGCTQHDKLNEKATIYCRNAGWKGAKNRAGLDRCSLVGSVPGIHVYGRYRGIRFQCYR